jgi:hypothetical protein
MEEPRVLEREPDLLGGTARGDAAFGGNPVDRVGHAGDRRELGGERGVAALAVVRREVAGQLAPESPLDLLH